MKKNTEKKNKYLTIGYAVTILIVIILHKVIFQIAKTLSSIGEYGGSFLKSLVLKLINYDIKYTDEQVGSAMIVFLIAIILIFVINPLLVRLILIKKNEI